MNPVIIRMVVDLPAPFGPRKPSTSPRSIEKEIPSTARLVPKALAKLLTFIIVSASFLHEANSPDTQFRLNCKLVSWTVVLSASFWIRANALGNLGLIFAKDVQKFFRQRQADRAAFRLRSSLTPYVIHCGSGSSYPVVKPLDF